MGIYIKGISIDERTNCIFKGYDDCVLTHKKCKRFGGREEDCPVVNIEETQVGCVGASTVSEKHQLSEETSTNTSTDLISRQAVIEEIEQKAYRHTYLDQIIGIIDSLPSAEPNLQPACNQLATKSEPKTDDENELKFYYVESLDDYWVGRRLDNFYYATWHGRLGFVWSHSKYLPWGEHIVDENTLWKEHTYPSEPIEIPFTEWIVGFVKKYFTEPKTGKWIEHIGGISHELYYFCDQCYSEVDTNDYDFCPHCGVRMTNGKG